MQGDSEALRLRRSAGELTDGTGLLIVRKLWDQLGLGAWIDQQAGEIGGRYRPSLMVEVWVALLIYGGRGMDDLPRLANRGVRRLFGWKSVWSGSRCGWTRGSSRRRWC